MGRWIIILAVLLTLTLLWTRREPLVASRHVAVVADERARLRAYLRQGWTTQEAGKRARLEDESRIERETTRQRDAELGINLDTWRKEDALRTLARSLRLGMSTQETTALLGRPSLGVAPPNKKEPPAPVAAAGFSIPMADLDLPATGKPLEFRFEWGTLWVYSPDPSMQHSPGARQTFQMLYLNFGDNDRLKNWYWAEPTLVN